MKPSQIREDLKHVRSVHFALLIVSGTMLYLIVASWSEAPELHRQLSNLRDFLEDHQTTGVSLKLVDPKKAAEASDEILQAVQRAAGKTLRWADSPSPRNAGTGPATDLRCRGVNIKAQPGASLEHSIDAVMSTTCQFSLPAISEEQAKSIREWAAESTTVTMAGVYSDAYVKDLQVLHDPGAVNGNVGRIVMERVFVGSGDGHVDPTPVELPQVFQVGLRSDALAFPQGWLQQQFPVIPEHPELLALSPEGALQLVAAERTKGLESFKQSFLGVEIQAAHIGTVGPIIIFLILLYLFAYLSHLSALVPEKAPSTRESVDFYSPWLGATKSHAGLTGTAVTVAVIPCLTILLSLWRLRGLPIWLSVVLAIVAGLVPGARIAGAGFRLAARRVEIGTADKSSAVATEHA